LRDLRQAAARRTARTWLARSQNAAGTRVRQSLAAVSTTPIRRESVLNGLDRENSALGTGGPMGR